MCIRDSYLYKGRLKDTTQFRLGGEYLFIQEKYVIPVRVGLFYDPEPGYRAYPSPDGSNWYSMTTDDYLGFSVGTGITYRNLSFDCSYQYRRCSDASSDIPQPGISMGVTQHTVMASLIYRF